MWLLAALAAATSGSGGGASKHIDWYCNVCDEQFINASHAGAHPELVDGIMPGFCGPLCDHAHRHLAALYINCTDGQLPVITHNLSVFSPWLRAGRTVNPNLSGDASCCRHPTDCPILENKEALAGEVLALALLYNLSGYTMDWEFGESIDWDGFNATMGYVATTLRAAGKGLGISINSGCESGVGSAVDPSCNPAYRDTPWASVLTDMGTYAIGEQQPTATRRVGDRCPGKSPAPHPAEVTQYCGYEGQWLNVLESPIATAHAQSWPQLSPAMWIGQCFANGTTARGWTRQKWRDHLAFLDTRRIPRIGIWCHGGHGNQGIVGFPCPTVEDVCPWFYTELAAWKARPVPGEGGGGVALL